MFGTPLAKSGTVITIYRHINQQDVFSFFVDGEYLLSLEYFSPFTQCHVFASVCYGGTCVSLSPPKSKIDDTLKLTKYTF